MKWGEEQEKRQTNDFVRLTKKDDKIDFMIITDPIEVINVFKDSKPADKDSDTYHEVIDLVGELEQQKQALRKERYDAKKNKDKELEKIAEDKLKNIDEQIYRSGYSLKVQIGVLIDGEEKTFLTTPGVRNQINQLIIDTDRQQTYNTEIFRVKRTEIKPSYYSVNIMPKIEQSQPAVAISNMPF